MVLGWPGLEPKDESTDDKIYQWNNQGMAVVDRTRLDQGKRHSREVKVCL